MLHKNSSFKRLSTFPAIILAGLIFSFIILSFHLFTSDENKRFQAYTDTLFRQEVSGNAITLHYTLKDTSSYHIHNVPTTLGQISTDTDAIIAAAENAIAALHSYQPAKLNNENQLTYQLLENTFNLSKDIARYALYEEPLSPLTGTQAQLPVLLSEYQFYSQQDVNTYLRLLKNFPEYFQGIMEFETAKADLGLFMTERRADAVIEECQAFINMGTNNYLHHTFKKRLATLNLSAKDSQAYIEQNASIIKTHVYPAYELLKSHLISLKKRGVNENGLFYLPNGKNYYELLVKEVTGSERTILELQTLTLRQINEDLRSMENLLSTSNIKNTSTNVESSRQSDILSDSNPTSILAALKEKLAENFPTPPDVNVSVKYVDKSMENYLSPAFYLIPAIDNSDENTIYINPAHMNDDLTLFTTLAHEGYPGHLYQTTYFNSTAPAPLRHLLGCGGYTEGWATYCEMMSYYWTPINKEDASLLQKNASVMLGLYALADMGIHYEGWTLTDTIDFFSNYGINDTGAIQEIFHLILGDPANYLKYYIGYVEFLELKKDAINKWGDEFSQERFHKEILEAGPIPFSILRSQLKLG